ncbi:MAG TPA: iron-sulfur cluster assembly protein [Methylomirabilota bacterium]|nr:iron-sulfur cluster assembly protein [Methylomirabilota bacterium]
MSGPGPSAGSTPSPTLPLSYLVTAVAAFVLACAAVPALAPELAGHYYHPRLTALAHTVTLGWITLGIMGASYQLIPIVLERRVWSERLARWQFWILAVGIAGMVAHFYMGRWPGLLMAAVMVGAGVAMHLVNVALTLRGVKRWTFTARFIAMAYTGLALTVVFGLVLGADRIWKFLPGSFFPTLHAHFHLALLGWVAPMVIGVAARVYPMFLLAPEPSGWPERVQFWGLALGVPAVVTGLLAAPAALLVPGAIAVAAAAAAHLTWVSRMARDRKRPALDWGLRFVLTGSTFLIAAGAMGLALAFNLLSGPRAALAYAVLALGGWVSLTIVGMMLKIIPFLVWYRVYSPLAGRAPVPTLAQLGWPAAERLAYGLLTGGVAALAAALATGHAQLIGAAGAVLAAGALCFAATVASVLHHMAQYGRRPAIAGSSDAPTREQVLQALGGVLDPELGMSVVELGLVYGIEIVNGAVNITMTLTAPGCPVHEIMPGWIRRVVMAVPGVVSVDVRITFDPPWTPDRINQSPGASRTPL